jgi:hypothetical protein
MDLWDVMISIFFFMMLVGWFWLLIWIISDVFRDDELSGVAKAAWCTFIVLLPWAGVLTYLIARGSHMADRMPGVGVGSGGDDDWQPPPRPRPASVIGELSALADMHDRQVLTDEEYQNAKQRVLAKRNAGAGTPQPA